MRFVAKRLLILVCAISLVVMPNNSSYISAFASQSHKDVTAKGINLATPLLGDNGGRVYTHKAKGILGVFCIQPDIDEIDGGNAYHFFNYITRKNFKGGEETALSKCCTHFYMALTHWAAYLETKLDTYRTLAIQELGRAMHFLQDLCTPVHSNNLDLKDAGINLYSHVKYESLCDIRCSEIQAVMLPARLDFFRNNSISQICMEAARRSAQIFAEMKAGRLAPAEAADLALKNAQEFTAGVAYKFVYKAVIERGTGTIDEQLGTLSRSPSAAVIPFASVSERAAKQKMPGLLRISESAGGEDEDEGSQAIGDSEREKEKTKGMKRKALGSSDIFGSLREADEDSQLIGNPNVDGEETGEKEKRDSRSRESSEEEDEDSHMTKNPMVIEERPKDEEGEG